MGASDAFGGNGMAGLQKESRPAMFMALDAEKAAAEVYYLADKYPYEDRNTFLELVIKKLNELIVVAPCDKS